MDLTAHRGEYLRLFADCIPVKGVRRSAIYDLTRSEIHLFPTEYYPLLEWLTSRSVASVIKELHGLTSSSSPSYPAKLEDFLGFLVDNELAMFTADPSRFPPIQDTWDYPGEIQSAIIDVDMRTHDFRLILGQLDALGCQFLQVRGFSPILTLAVCKQLLANAADTSITSVELILRYDPAVSDEDLVEFLRGEPLVTSLTVHSAPERGDLSVQMAERNGTQPTSNRVVRFTPQVIDSEKHCGLITQDYLSPPSVATYVELRHFNGCLNRKIGIDADGEIRNCPSMRTSFGHAGSTRLVDVVGQPAFRAAWSLSKDGIDVCSGCEFRYVCTDCRAYVERPEDPTSKPLKCGYDPETATWEPWYRPAFKAAVSSSYGMADKHQP